MSLIMKSGAIIVRQHVTPDDNGLNLYCEDRYSYGG